jgi:hypothetical protein
MSSDNVGLALHKDFDIQHDWKFGLSGEFFNALNHASFANPDSGAASPMFGIISSTQHQAHISDGFGPPTTFSREGC